MACRKALLAGLLLAAFVLSVFPDGASAQDPRDYFRQNCKSCHTIGGGRMNGPDLKDVTTRQERAWLVNFIQDPKGVIDRGDPYAQQIFQEARQTYMTQPYGMTPALAEKLLTLIEEESAKEESEFKGLQLSNEPFTGADVQQGREIFLGKQRLSAGGSACISCHSTRDLRALGGGRLGPDLTDVFNRLGGREKLGNWLSAPATATMQPIFKNNALTSDEIKSLLAYFDSTKGQTDSDPVGSRLMFLLLGLLASTGLMFAFDAAWKWRFRGVRQPLVEAGKTTR